MFHEHKIYTILDII